MVDFNLYPLIEPLDPNDEVEPQQKITGQLDYMGIGTGSLLSPGVSGIVYEVVDGAA